MGQMTHTITLYSQNFYISTTQTTKGSELQYDIPLKWQLTNTLLSDIQLFDIYMYKTIYLWDLRE